MKYTVLMVIFTILILGGCTKKESPSPRNNSSTLTESNLDNQEPPEGMGEERDNVKSPDTMFTGREDFFSSAYVIGPVDMTLGNLPIRQEMSPSELQRYELLQNFISALEKGKSWTDYIIPDKVLLYKTLWEDRLVPSLREIVIGAEINQNEVYSYNVRLVVSDSSYGEGIITITKEESHYYIDDFLFDSDDFSIVRSEKEPFQPEYTIDVNNLVY